MRKKLILTIAFSILCLNACSKHNTQSSNPLIVDIGGEPSSLDPAIAQEGTAFRVIYDLFAGLMDFDQNNNPIPGMAYQYEISNDGLIYTFYLRKNLKFSNGVPIYASDFVYSWKRLVDPTTGSAYNFILDDVANAPEIVKGQLNKDQLEVKALDNYTLQVKLSHPNKAFLAKITLPAAFVVPQQQIEKFGNSWINPNHVVTSGAYVLKQHIVNGDIEVQKNSNYYNAQQVNIENIQYLPLVNTSVSLADYASGNLDTTWQSVPVDELQKLKNQYPSQLHIFPWESIESLSFNMLLSKYANNPKLRRALSMAIDRDTIANQVLKGGQKPLYSVVTPTIENGAYSPVKYSWSGLSQSQKIAVAKRLYHEAGYSKNKPLEVTISYRNNDITKKVILAVATMWHEELGVKVNLQNLEYRVLLSSLRSGNFDISWGRWGADFNDITTYTPIYTCGNAYNYAHQCSKNYDFLINQAQLATDATNQKNLYTKALDVILNSYATIPLFEPSHQRLVRPRVIGYKIDQNYLDNVQSKWMSINKCGVVQ